MSYYNEIKAFNNLSTEQEVELFNAYNSGCMKSKDKLIKHNLKLVIFIAKPFFNNNFDDIIQIGNIALIEAIERFNTSTNYRFNSYAFPYIRGKILNYVNQNKIISFPIDDEIELIEQTIFNSPDNLTDDKILVIKLLNTLNNKEKSILLEYFMGNKTFDIIAKENKTSKQLIHHHYKKAIKKLKDKITDRNIKKYYGI